MKYSGIGGQAVIEGIMMKNDTKYAIAVRKPDKEIEIQVSEYSGVIKNKKIRNMPIIRGVFSFIESLTLGMKSINFSASFYEEEDTKPVDEKKENLMMTITMAVSIVLAIAIFMVLPYGISLLFQKFVESKFVLALLEGAIRLVIFIGYVAGISFLEDIRRVYMYHGAEHKCINCIENGMELTVENVRKSSRLHKRCGTSFLLIVMLISILFFMVIQVDNSLLRLGLRIVLIPVIAGVSFEFIRLAGRSDNCIVGVLSKPGLWLQKITTREPDDDMIKVGIASIEAVFDWKSYIEKLQKEKL